MAEKTVQIRVRQVIRDEAKVESAKRKVSLQSFVEGLIFDACYWKPKRKGAKR